MSDRDYLYGHVCRHGQLARSCQVCDLEDEVWRLRDENVDALIEVYELRAAIREHDWRYTLDGGGRARCYPVMGELLPGDDDG